MKKLLIVLLSAAVALSASAQPKIGGGFRSGGNAGGHVYYVQPRVMVVSPYVYASPYYRSRLGYGFSPFYDPFYRSPRYQSRPSQLDLQIEDIKNDFSYQISTAKHDKSLSKDERKQKVRDLKHQREDAIIGAKKEYYAQRNNDKTS